MSDDIVERLKVLCNPRAECLSDGTRITQFVKYGTDARHEITRLRAERDALLARLAPVDDKALVEIAADAISDGSKNIARAALAAIRPHIEAAERERCAKIAEARLRTVIDLPDGFINGWERCQRSIAAAIRSGK